MKFFISILISSIFIFIASAQNLVSNPSFEDTVTCPNNQSQIHLAKSWSSYRKTPEYFNKCSSSNVSSVPSNSFGFQIPGSCNAYAGVYSWGGFNWREYIGSQLLSPLMIGQKYFISFKVALAEASSLATNKMGVLFSTVSFNDSMPTPLTNFAHVLETSIITDTANWTVISGSFTADSNYKYLIVGNFFDDTNTDTMVLTSGVLAYYFIDDICVSLDSTVCIPYSFICNTGLLENNEEDLITFFPNPTGNSITLEIKIKMQYAELRIYDLFGKEVKKIFIANNENYIIIERDDLTNGIYLFQLQIGYKTINQKFVLTN